MCAVYTDVERSCQPPHGCLLAQCAERFSLAFILVVRPDLLFAGKKLLERRLVADWIHAGSIFNSEWKCK
jgi:hypothetical protein